MALPNCSTLDSGVVTLRHLTDITEEVGNNCPSFLPRTTFSLWSHVVTTPIILRQAPQCCRITLRANYISPWGVCSRHTLDFALLLSALGLGPGPRCRLGNFLADLMGDIWGDLNQGSDRVLQ